MDGGETTGTLLTSSPSLRVDGTLALLVPAKAFPARAMNVVRWNDDKCRLRVSEASHIPAYYKAR